MPVKNSVVLRNRLEVSKVGLGSHGIWGKARTWDSQLTKDQYNIYLHALESGKCKLFDTSIAYGLNEEVLGKAIQDTNTRNNVLIMTKIGNRAQQEGNHRKALEESLSRLKTDYIDLYLIHWPQTETFVNTWLSMEKFYEEGLVRAIGVCNFHKHHLEELMCKAHIMPMVNQFEIHPLFTQETLINYCYANEIQVIAYTPIARMHDVLIKSKPIYTLSEKYGKTPVQIILRWHYQLDRIAIPRTLNPAHFDEIFESDFELNDREMAWISSLNENIRLRYNPDTCDFSRL